LSPCWVGGPVFTGGDGVPLAGAFGPFSAGWFGGATASCGVAGSLLERRPNSAPPALHREPEAAVPPGEPAVNREPELAAPTGEPVPAGSRRGRRCNPRRRRRRRICPWGRGRGERGRDAPGERGQRNCRPGRQHDDSPATTTKPVCAPHRALLLSSSGWQIACHLPRQPACLLASAATLPKADVYTLQQTLRSPRSVDSHAISLLAERLRFFGIRGDPSLLRHPVLSDTANCEVA
jgi:hypothetical protein